MLDELHGHVLRKSTLSGYLMRRQWQRDSAMGIEELLVMSLSEA